MSELLHFPSRQAEVTIETTQSPQDHAVPVDEFGMPYLIHPYRPPRGMTQRWDDDHSFFFRDLPELNDEAGKALRLSRVQHVPRWLHDRKHNDFYPGGVEQLPQTDADKFALTVLACGGYTSRLALDLRGGDPKLVKMSRPTYDFVRGKKQLHPETRKDHGLGYRTPGYSLRVIGTFFADYVRKQHIDEVVDESVIDEFLHTRNTENRAMLGNFIIEKAIDLAVEPIEPKYRIAAKAGLVRPRAKRASEAVKLVFKPQRWADYHEAMSAELAA